MATTIKFVQGGSGLVTAALAAGNNKYCSMGTGGTTATDGDTAMGTQVEGRTSGTQSQVEGDHSNDTYQVVGEVAATASRAVIEAGLHSAATEGTLMARASFDAINLDSGDSIEFTWQIKFPHS